MLMTPFLTGLTTDDEWIIHTANRQSTGSCGGVTGTRKRDNC